MTNLQHVPLLTANTFSHHLALNRLDTTIVTASVSTVTATTMHDENHCHTCTFKGEVKTVISFLMCILCQQLQLYYRVQLYY